MIDRRYTPEELRAVIAQAEGLIGDRLEPVVRRYRSGATSLTPPAHQNRLVDLLLRLRKAADNSDDRLAEGVAVVAIAELGGILEIFEHWRLDPTWPEFQHAVREAETYLHAVTTLSVGMALKEHHARTELVPSSTPGRTPDLRLVVTETDNLGVEVKTSQDLGQRGRAMSESEAREYVADCLHASSRQRKAHGQPHMLAIGGFLIDRDTFNALGESAARLMRAGHERPDLLAIVISHTRFNPPMVVKRRVLVGLAHETRIISNPRYRGQLRFIGDWAGSWRFEKRV